MKPFVLLGAIATAFSIARDTPAQTRPEFSGHWTMGPTANIAMGGGRGGPGGVAAGGGGRGGGGAGLGPPAPELVILQNDTMMTIEDGTGGGTLVYRLDGGRTTNSITVGRGNTVQASYSSRWDGTQLVTTVTYAGPGNAGSTYLREVRFLADDGSMVVETTVTSGSRGRRTVYRKAAAAP